MDDFFKYPRTRHCYDTGNSVSRDDLLLTATEFETTFLQGRHVTVEEKVDGANLGLSIDPDNGAIRAQNRSHYVNSESHPQFAKLDAWLSCKLGELYDILEGHNYVLFGEWMSLQHSVKYNHLPDWFIAFDIYDKDTNAFLSRQTFHDLLGSTSIATVPVLHQGPLADRLQLEALLQRQSTYSSETLEGVYLRIDNQATNRLQHRSKLVRAEFLEGIDKKWDRELRKNELASF